ncbi:MAG: hypothetical protein ISS71_09700 [Phycisphaerae bacterium]|nr:hypothetical protein [Phycisphaerae bacterium]
MLTNDQEAQLETIADILQYIYEDNPLAIPSDVNGIAALKTSTESKDQLAFALFEMMDAIQNGELDLSVNIEADSAIAIEEAPVISDKSISAFFAEANKEIEFSPAPDLAVGFETASMFTMESAQELSGPLDSCIIPSGTYLITSLPLQIEGHVVICAGATLIAPFDPNSTIIEIMPGGLLETGKAAFYDQGDDPNILPPVKIVPEDPNIIYNHNNIGIYIHRGADPKTRIENVIVESCTVGIVMDEALEYPVRNVITFGCYDGIQVYAPAGIVDCQFWYNGSVWIGPFGYVGTGIYVSLDWDGDDPNVAIDRTTIYFADAALYVEGGSADPNNNEPNQVVPTVTVLNSALTGGMYYGLYQSADEAAIDVQYCAFGGNHYTSNINLPFTGCVNVYSNPFYNREEDWEKLYVNPWSGLIDAGYGMATDGTGVCHDKPDTGRMDIGCHFPLGISGGFGIPSCLADFNWDGIVDELDLELMQMCMSAVTDPNIVKLDGNYDSRINLPDFGLFAADYGYCGDPNFCSNNDPNCQRSDFNGDDWVDLTDFAILAESWLVPVFDEYRLCSLCNLSPSSDPNLPEVIDTNDMDVFMEDWGKQYTFEPNIVIEQSASQLSVTVENPDPAWKISAFLDEDLIGQWDAEMPGSTTFDVDLIRYGPGSHKLKVVRNIDDGLEITEKVISDPNSTGLYFADIPDTFEPNEPYCLRGFNLSDELNIKINDIWDQPVYDVNIPSGAVNLQVSAETLGDDQIYTVSTEGFDGNVAKRDIVKEFRQEDWPNGARMVIIVPEWKIWWNRRAAILACAQACTNRGVSWVSLYRKNVTAENLTYLLPRQTTRYVYWCGHGNSLIGDIPRTFTMSWKQTVRNWWRDAWERIPVFSFTNRSLQGYPTLPEDWDNRGFDLWSLGMHDEPDKWIVFIDTCQSATLPDMAGAYGIFNSGNNNQIYIGWRAEITVNGIKETFSPRNFEKYTSHTNPGIERFWEKMGTGSTVQEALQATTDASYLGQDPVIAIWGENTMMDLADPDSDDSIRVIGNGLTNKLSNSN